MTDQTHLRPRCSTCYYAPRVEGTVQCEFCGPSRLFEPFAHRARPVRERARVLDAEGTEP